MSTDEKSAIPEQQTVREGQVESIELEEEVAKGQGTSGEEVQLSAAQKESLQQKQKKGEETTAQLSASSEVQPPQARSTPLATMPTSEEIPRLPGTDLPDLVYHPKVGQKILQTFPPTVPVGQLFPRKRYPVGKTEKYADDSTTHRSSDSGKIRIEILNDGMTNDFRKAAEVHRQMRAFSRQLLRPGIRLIDFVTEVEMRGRLILEESFLTKVRKDLLSASCATLCPAMMDLYLDALSSGASSSATAPSDVPPAEVAGKSGKGKGKGKGKAKPSAAEAEAARVLISSLYPEYTHATCGLAFPTGLSLNNCAAHYTPNPGDERVLLETDIIKIDIGTHVNGHIIDSAFSMSWNPKMTPLIQASKEATWMGLRMSGIDARLVEIGDAIEEVITSFEVEEGGRMRGVKPVRNLSGHSVSDYVIHSGKLVPIHKNACDSSLKMEEGDSFAIETFATTGKGSVSDAPDCSHYMLRQDAMSRAGTLRNPKARHLLNHIHHKFRTLAWCRRWLEETGEKQHAIPLKALVDADLVKPCPPLNDISNCHVSQHEHTILLKPTGKEVASFGDDD